MSNYKLVADENGPLSDGHIACLRSASAHDFPDANKALRAALTAAQSPTPPPSPVALVEALKTQREWAEKLAARIRKAVHAFEELKDPLAFADLDEDFYNGIAASYQADYEAALAHLGETGRKG